MNLATCMGLACSEVRAAKVAECSGHYFDYFKRSCVAAHATRSTAVMFEPRRAEQCVGKVFERCIAAPLTANPLLPGKRA